MRKHAVLLAVAVLVVVASAAGLLLARMSYSVPIKDIRTVQSQATTTMPSMSFEIADTPAKQEQGLSNRASIPDNYAMLFVFRQPARVGFWMKDMLVPIDMIWLSDNGTIVLVDHSVDPSTYPHAFYPPVPVPYVLETRAGYANDHGWDVGKKVALPAPYGHP